HERAREPLNEGDPIVKTFLAVGDLLINPNLLAYAAVEGDAEEPKLRLAFSSSAPGAYPRNEIRLAGEEARATLRWLRLNATYLNQAAAFGTPGSGRDGGSGRLVPSYGDDPVREVRD